MAKTNSNGKRSGQTSHRAASYIRMSSHKQETSPEQQRREIIELAKRKGYEIVERYIDEGISGDEIEKCPDFLRMLKDGQAGKFDVILCWDQDRFGRFDSLKAGYIIEPLRMRGIRLVTVTQGEIDWNDFAGRMMYAIQQEGKNQFLHSLSQNVLRALIQSAKDGHRVKPTILAHPEFAAYQRRVRAIFDQWRAAHSDRLHGLKVNDLPRQVIHDLSEDLLARFTDVPLLSRYDVYQRLMDYWAEVMQDDVYLIAAEGWQEAAKPRSVIDDKDKKIKETPDLVIKKKKYKMDLIPPPLIVARFFAAEQSEVERLESEVAAATESKDEFEEEHAGDEGALNGLEGKSGITKGNVQQRAMELKQSIMDAFDKNTPQHKQAVTIKKTTFGSAEWITGTKDEDGLFEELDILYEYLQIADTEAAANKAVKDAQEKLDARVLKKYGDLSETEIKTLTVDDKWFVSLQSAIEGEVNRITQRLAERVKDLEERYETTLPELEESVGALSSRVVGHLKQMGLVWA